MKTSLVERIYIRVYRKNGSEWIPESLDIDIVDGVVDKVMFNAIRGMFESRYNYNCAERWIDGLAATIESIIFDNIVIDLRTGIVEKFEYTVTTTIEEEDEVIRQLNINMGFEEPEDELEDEELEDSSIA